MEFCVEESKMPRAHFSKTFPGNETNLKWLKEQMKVRNLMLKHLEKLKHDIIDQQKKLIDLEEMLEFQLKF